MTPQGGAALSRRRKWAIAAILGTLVAAICVGFPFAATSVAPGIDSTVLMVGGAFFGLVLGSAAVIGFMEWTWRRGQR
ncbi:hypothetical protein [Streptomyces sp. NEAU-H3]|uniref:hypothetical protein n=1 Tax=Streptomyces sp. NEAU-H3 TaxID=2720636 RepID=UPI00143C9245|nr:hypothetical protein [Streptomyces sp. NEAU-H3]NJA56719.1 hypothetical protein [Streptomyces sp. NEAU-H3]